MRGISADFQRLFALDAGEHHDDEASPELSKSIAARLDAKLQKHAKGSWAKLFFVIDNDGSGGVEFHEFL